MKKLLSVLLCVVILASVIAIPVSAECVDKLTCTHEHSVRVLEKDATLFEDGYTGVLFCLDCQQIYLGETTNALYKETRVYQTVVQLTRMTDTVKTTALALLGSL